MGISENQYYRLSGVCGIVTVVLALPLAWILGVGHTDILCLLAGILAAVALFIENKICLLLSMICAILGVISLAFVIMATVLTSGVCNINDCDLCIESGTCTGANCEWVGSYTKVDCNCDCTEKNTCTGANCVCPNADIIDENNPRYYVSSSGPTEIECNAAKAAGGQDFLGGWACTSSTAGTYCADGTSGKTFNNGDCTKVADGTYTAVESQDKVSCPDFYDSAGKASAGKTWANTGCEMNDVSDEIEQFCNYVNLASVLLFLEFGTLITGSVGACCVWCCGKGPDSGGDDDGDKSDE